jgi:hypothetical protein
VAAAEIKLDAADLERIDSVVPPGSAAGERYADMRFVGGKTPPAS